MNRAWGIALVVGSVLGTIAFAQTKPAPASRGPRLQAVTLVIRNRVFHEFEDVERVKLNQEFLLGDSDYSARVVEYVPDFELDLDTRKVFSRTPQPNNPAFKVIVRKGKVPQDTSWAFINMPPHFGRRSYFAFQVVRIDFLDHAPVLADTAAAAPAGTPGAPARADSASRDSAGHP